MTEDEKFIRKFSRRSNKLASKVEKDFYKYRDIKKIKPTGIKNMLGVKDSCPIDESLEDEASRICAEHGLIDSTEPLKESISKKILKNKQR